MTYLTTALQVAPACYHCSSPATDFSVVWANNSHGFRQQRLRLMISLIWSGGGQECGGLSCVSLGSGEPLKTHVHRALLPLRPCLTLALRDPCYPGSFTKSVNVGRAVLSTLFWSPQAGEGAHRGRQNWQGWQQKSQPWSIRIRIGAPVAAVKGLEREPVLSQPGMTVSRGKLMIM